MHERESLEAPRLGFPRWSTAVLAIVGASLFLSGMFVLTEAGHVYPWWTHFFILCSAAVLALPLLLVTFVVAVSEAVIGRAWANGLRRLAAADRRFRATSIRALRYASVLWLANGAAMWLATILGRL